MLFTPRTGGRTTQYGITYQNRVAVFRLAALLAQELMEPASVGRVVSVQPEADEEVDDVVISYSSGRKEYIQVKTDVARESKAWTMLWKHFHEQFRKPEFNRSVNGDFITLAVGPKARLYDLSDLLGFANDEISHERWLSLPALNKKHLAFLKSIRNVLNGVDDEELYQLCKRIRVWQINYGTDPNGRDEFRHLVQKMLKGIVEPVDSVFAALQDFVGERAIKGKPAFFADVVDFLDSQGISVISPTPADLVLPDEQQRRRKQKIGALKNQLSILRETALVAEGLTEGALNDPARSRYQKQLEELRVAQENIEQQIGSLESAAQLKAEARRADEVSDPNTPQLGPHVHLMCDRTSQEQEFFSAFLPHMDQHPGMPQMYLLPGPDGENHNSLVARFRYTWIEDYVKTRVKEQNAGVVIWDDIADWPSEGNLQTRQFYLSVALFKKCEKNFLGRKRTEYTANNFRTLISAQKHSFIVIQHDVKTWDEETKLLIKWYGEFWNEVKLNSSDLEEPFPQCLVFLNIIYPVATKGTGDEATQSPTLILKDIEALSDAPELALAQDKQHHWVRLKPLACVKKDHVRSWFKTHKIPSSTLDPEDEYDEIFRTRRGTLSQCKNMREVEGKLRIICQKLTEEPLNGY